MVYLVIQPKPFIDSDEGYELLQGGIDGRVGSAFGVTAPRTVASGVVGATTAKPVGGSIASTGADYVVGSPNANGSFDFGQYASRVAQIESGGNPLAKNPNSSAGGLYQFIDSTWKQYGAGGNRFNAADATAAFKRFTNANKSVLTKALGREPTQGELYLAHQQGAGGALKLLTNPDGNAMATVGADAIRLNGGDATMTNAEFARKWTDKLDGSSPVKGAQIDKFDGGMDAGGTGSGAGDKGAGLGAVGSIAQAIGVNLTGAQNSTAEAQKATADATIAGAQTIAATTAAEGVANRTSYLDSFKDYFARFVILMLGLVIVGGGVFMFAKGQGGASVVGTAKKAAKRLA